MRSIYRLMKYLFPTASSDNDVAQPASEKLISWARRVGLQPVKSAVTTSSGRRIRRNFTLVELLTVIAIITTLFSILMPTMQNAVLHARKVYCISNLRNIALGYAQYRGDFNRYPNCIYWLNDFRPVDSYIKSYKVFRCPSSRLPAVTDYEQLLTWTDYLISPGTIKDIELSASLINSGHGNNIYDFDPFNPSRPTQTMIAAKRKDHFVYDRYVPAHPRRTINLVKFDDLSYESIYGVSDIWMLDSQGRLLRSMEAFPVQ